MPTHTELGEFIWRIADHLRGDYEKNDNEDVILPFTLLRRLDCVLEKTRDKVRETEAQVKGKVTDEVLKKLLVGASGVPFYNRSKFSFAELLKDAANIKENFGSYLEGFSDNIKEILYNFSGGEEKGLAPIYETLARKNLLYLITKEFASEDLNLHPDVVTNHEMGLIYEYLIRKFKEGAAAGEQYTPRDVVQLLVQLVLADVEHTLKKSKGTLVAIYDPAAGTGGMLTVAKEYLTAEWGLDPTNVFIYGQELREKTYAICKADALMKPSATGTNCPSNLRPAPSQTAVTSHSSQGQTADRVLIHVDTELGPKDLLNNRMAYVAVSRGACDAQMDRQRCLSTAARTISARIFGFCRVAQPPVVLLPHGVDGDAIR